jgi:hypothetical protein
LWKGAIGKECGTEIQVPVLLVLVTGPGEGFTKCSIIPFGKSIGLGVVGGGPMLLDVEVDAELLNQLVFEMGTLIREDFSGDTVVANNFVHEKGGDGLGSSSLNGLGFGPLGKIFRADKDVSVAGLGCGQGTDEVQSNSIEGFSNRKRLEAAIEGDLATALARIAGLDEFLDIFVHVVPIIMFCGSGEGGVDSGMSIVRVLMEFAKEVVSLGKGDNR